MNQKKKSYSGNNIIIPAHKSKTSLIMLEINEQQDTNFFLKLPGEFTIKWGFS